MNSNSSRLIVVDALRGFAIVCIMLFHNLEHFDYYYFPTNLPNWILALDKVVWKVIFFVFANKAYGIFALLFGLTFFIQLHNQEKIGKDFRGRFAWRLLLLFVFGIINSAFFGGDILSIYAILGLFLIPVAKLNNRIVFAIALILLLQPFEIAKLIKAMFFHKTQTSEWFSALYYTRSSNYIPKNSLINTLVGNITNGKIANILWGWESGRLIQNLALFMVGMLAGRKQLFFDTEKNKHFWVNTLFIAAICFIILHGLEKRLGHIINSRLIFNILTIMVDSWANFSFMLIILSIFVLLFRTQYFNSKLNFFSYMGRMSLSNYFMQSVMGSFIYYGFGLGLYKYTGATYCLLIGLVLAIVQFLFSYWWMKNHKQGPLETIWHKGTWIFYK